MKKSLKRFMIACFALAVLLLGYSAVISLVYDAPEETAPQDQQTQAGAGESFNSFDFHGSVLTMGQNDAANAEAAQAEKVSVWKRVWDVSCKNVGTLALIGFAFLVIAVGCLCSWKAFVAYQADKRKKADMAKTEILKTFVLAPNKWLIYAIVALIVAFLIVWSSSSIEWKGLASKGSEVAYGIIYGITHPDASYLLSLASDKVPYLLLETIAIALLGTLIGGVLAVPIAFLASENVVPKWASFLMRALVLSIRTIPSLVWALCWIRVTGPGAFCGVLTQSVCSIGMITKMYITAIEDLDTKILESLDASGCTTFQKIRYGIIPQLTANFISTTIYRFDINLKDATTLGIVGAGGIGAALIQAISSRRWGIVGSFLFGMIILMMIIEFVSTRIRSKLARGQ